MPLVCHAEGRTTAAILLLAELADRPVHVAHVARKEEVRKQILCLCHCQVQGGEGGEEFCAILLLAELADRPVHIAHVAHKEEVRKQSLCLCARDGKNSALHT